MKPRTTDRLKIVRDRVAEAADWRRHQAAHLLRRMVMTNRYVPGTPLPLDASLVRLVHDGHHVQDSWEEVLDIQEKARQLADAPQSGAHFLLTVDALAEMLSTFAPSQIYPHRSPRESAQAFLESGRCAPFRLGESYPRRQDWLENLLLAWQWWKPQGEPQPDALVEQMVRWLRERGYPAEPVPLTVDRVAQIWESWFGILVFPDPRDILARETRFRQRINAFCSLGEWAQALSLAGVVERTEGADLDLLRTKILCLIRLERYSEALVVADQWHERAREGRVSATREEDLHMLQIEAWIGARMWNEALSAIEGSLERIESCSAIGDMRYELCHAGVIGHGIVGLSSVAARYAQTVDVLGSVDTDAEMGPPCHRLNDIVQRALRLGERILRVFPRGVLDPSSVSARENGCLRTEA